MGWDHIRDMYRAYRFRDAYDETETWWSRNTLPPDLGTGELVLAGRLAERLGGIRVSRQLLRMALNREPDHPEVVLYVEPRLERGSSLYTQLLRYERSPQIPGADRTTQMYWMSGRVFLLASLRSFRDAERALSEVKERFGEHNWLTLAAAELAYARDRWQAADALAMEAFHDNPRMYHVLHLLSRIAARRRDIPTLLQRFESIRGDVQDCQIAMLHVWYLIAQAERCSGLEKAEALAAASLITDRYDVMVPLADRHTREHLAISRLDLATAKGDRGTMWRESNRMRSPWHQRLAGNLRKRPDGERRIVAHRPLWQGRNTCLPCSVCTLHPEVEFQKLVGELTYGGTSVVRCNDWLKRKADLHAVPFVATAQTVRRIAKAGIGFIYLTGGDNWAHAMAAIGVDEATDTLLIHDPSSTRLKEVLLDDIKLHEGPFGPQCIALMPADRVPEVTALIPDPDRLPYLGYLEFNEQLRRGDDAGAADTLRELQRLFADHPFTLRVQAAHDMHCSRLPAAVEALEKLLSEHPANLHIRVDLIHALHRARNTRRQTEVYHDLMERGTWGEYKATPTRHHPVYVARYADSLGLTGSGLTRAATLLRIALRKSPGESELWHILGDMLWRQGDLAGAWVPLEAASHLAAENEHYARSLVDVGSNIGQLERAFDHLEYRARNAGTAVGAGAPWATWIEALAEFGFPKKAQDVLAEALGLLPRDPDLLTFALQFQADHGFPDQARALLSRVRSLEDINQARRAEARYLQSVGQPQDALAILEERLTHDPSDVDLARQVTHLLSGSEGTETVLIRAREWAETWPNDEGFEDLLYEVLQDQHHDDEAAALMRRRLERNPQDTWAWIERGHAEIRRAELAKGEERERRLTECAATMEIVLKVSTPNATRIMLEARYMLAAGRRGETWDLLLDALRLESDRHDALDRATELLRESPQKDRLEPMQELLQLLKDRGSESAAIPEFFDGWADTFGMEDALRQVRRWRADRPNSQLLARTEVSLLLHGIRGRRAAAEALELLEGLTERFPQVFAFAVERAEALRGMNDVEGMRRAYADLLERFPLHLHSRDKLASAMVQEGEIDEAIALLREGVERQPQNRESWRMLASFLDNLALKEDAVEVLLDGVTRMPRDIGLHRYLVDLLLDLDRDAEAVEHARTLVQQFDNGSYIWCMLGATLERTGLASNQDEIEEAYRMALKYNPSLYEAADHLARFLTVNGRPEEATEVLETFHGTEDHAAPMAGRRIWMLAKTGQMDDACDQIGELLKAHPNYLWGWHCLMDWLEERGDATRAGNALNEIPKELRHQVEWRVRRVQVLENCGAKEEALEKEWEALIADYPTDSQVVLTYIDRCMERDAWAQAEEWLNAYAAQDPNAPYVQARLVRVYVQGGRSAEAIDLAFEIWSRPGWDMEWADHTAWTELTAVPETRHVWRTFKRHLRKKGHLRPGMVDAIVQKCQKRINWRLVSLVRRHPESNRLLAGLLDAFADLGLTRRANRIWRGLPDQARHEPELWSSGIRAANAAAKSRHSVRRLRARLKGWEERDTVDMWVLANVIDAHIRNLNLLKARRRVFRGEDRTWLETVVGIAEHAMRRLRFDHAAQFIGRAWITALLALGRAKEAAAVYREFEHVFNDARTTFWTEPVTQALGQHLPKWVQLLEESPLSLLRITAKLEMASAVKYAPVAVYGALVEELRRQTDVEERTTQFTPRAPT